MRVSTVLSDLTSRVLRYLLTHRISADDLEELQPGQRVQYAQRISTRNGKPEAIAVELVAEDEPPARAGLAVAFGDR